MWLNGDDLMGAFWVALAVAGIVGWAVIEVVLWVIGSISISWG